MSQMPDTEENAMHMKELIDELSRAREAFEDQMEHIKDVIIALQITAQKQKAALMNASWHCCNDDHQVTPIEKEVVWAYVPSAMILWQRYTTATYMNGMFWRGAEHVAGVTHWCRIGEVKDNGNE